MERKDTQTKCVFCKSEVAAEINRVQSREILDGPSSGDCYSFSVKFCCSNSSCGLAYAHPPGRPNAAAEIIADIKTKERTAENDLVLAELDRKLQPRIDACRASTMITEKAFNCACRRPVISGKQYHIKPLVPERLSFIIILL